MKLKTGLSWYDPDPKKPFAQKVAQAAARYAQKHDGAAPDLCHVHPSTLDGQPRHVGPVAVVALRTVQRNYFWIGERGRLPTTHSLLTT